MNFAELSNRYIARERERGSATSEERCMRIAVSGRHRTLGRLPIDE